MTGRVSSLYSGGTADGPGVRMVVFFSGCPLRCGYCHNPETWQSGNTMEEGELLDKILSCKPYFGSRGGVTFSGGEPLMQPEFLLRMIELCRKHGINTCVDTAGSILKEGQKKALRAADLVILDLKFNDNEQYCLYTGGDFDTPFNTLRYLDEIGKQTWVRRVVVPGLNDSDEDVGKLNDLAGFSCVSKIQLLPFKKLCREKYQNLGIPFAFEKYDEASEELIAKKQKLILLSNKNS